MVSRLALAAAMLAATLSPAIGAEPDGPRSSELFAVGRLLSGAENHQKL